MCSLLEAIAELNTGKIDEKEFHQLEAKTELYNQFFIGHTNDSKLQEEFDERKKKILICFNSKDLEEYQKKVKDTVKKNYDKANKEYLERIKNISPVSEEGKEKYPLLDVSILEDEETVEYPLTRFSDLTNLPIGRAYKCNEEGVFIWKLPPGEYAKISQPITIKNLFYDRENGKQYIELEFYNYQEGKKVESICLPTSELAKNSYEALISRGIIIDNAKLFTQYLNDLRTVDCKEEKIRKGKAQLNYGYPTKDDGSYDFNRFIGIGEENKIIPLIEYQAVDQAIFKEKGTVNGFVSFLEEVSKGDYTIDFQMVIAASLVGITQAYINNNSGMVAPPTYIFVGQTSIGKNLLVTLANNVWASPASTGNLICSSDSSKTFMYAMKNRLMLLPFLIADVQDLLDRDGVQALTDVVFSHSNGKSGGKGTTGGEVRSNIKSWNNPLIAFTEADVFTNNPEITGGADSRYTVLNLNVEAGKQLTQKKPKSYITKENENYAVLGKYYVDSMRNIKEEYILKRFNEITDNLIKIGVQEKQANSLGMLVLTDELANACHLFPSTWERLTEQRLMDWVGIKTITDSATEMYHMLSEHVFKDNSYVPNDDKYLTEDIKSMKLTEADVFRLRAKTPDEIRGRILWQKKNSIGEYEACKRGERERSLLLIPNQQLKQLFDYLIKQSDLKSFGFDKKKWVKNGWMLMNGKEYLFKDTFKINITRPRDTKNRESYYATVLSEDKED